MHKSNLRAVATEADTQYELAIPANTIRLTLRLISDTPFRVSFTDGIVAAASYGGRVVYPSSETELLSPQDGPLYFAASERGAQMDVDAWSESIERGGGAFDESFSDDWDIGVA